MRRLLVLLPMLAALAMTSAAAMADGLNVSWREARVVKLAFPAQWDPKLGIHVT